LAIKLGDALVYIGGDRSQLTGDLDKAEKQTKTWTVAVGTAVGGLMGGVITKGAEMAGNAIKGIGQSLISMTMDAAGVEGVRNTFARLTESIGGEATQALEALRVATRGMVADADLLGAGNKFLAMGLATTTEEAANLAEVATQLGSAMGEDATASMENFALMMANQSLPRLDSFGISSGKVRTRIEELMAATEGLTREQAFNMAVMEQAQVTMARVGEQGDTAQGAMSRIKATIANLRIEMGEKLLPIAAKVLGWFASLVEKYGPMVSEWFGKVAGKVLGFVNKIDDLIKSGDLLGSILDRVPGWMRPIVDWFIEAWEWLDAKLVPIINTLWDAFKALIEGDIDGFWGRIAAVLLELGVPIETIDKLRAFSEQVAETWRTKVGPFFTEVWENIVKPGLEGLWLFIKDNLKPVLYALGAAILIGVVGPMILAALPVIGLGLALMALGLLWKDHGEQVRHIVSQIGVIVSHVFSLIVEWVRNAIAAITGIEGPFGDMIRSIVGDGGKATRALDDMIERMREANRVRAEQIAAQPPPPTTAFGQGEAFQGALDVFRNLGNQDNSRNVTIYGGQQNYGLGAGQDPLAALWELGQ